MEEKIVVNDISLANRYRPKTWDDVVEQDITKSILDRAIRTNNVKNTMLFTGGAGTGKTTSARIFAHTIEPCTVNCREINAASQTGVDSMRDIIEDSKTKPLQGKYRVFILDEVHMLTAQAQAALLKLFEEPPSFCIYLLCTTDPQKLTDTIRSRVAQYTFNKISVDGIVNRLEYILNSEIKRTNLPLTWDRQSLEFIAHTSGGGMRDAITLLDKCISYGDNINIENTVKIAGGTPYNILFELLNGIMTKDSIKILNNFDLIYRSGADLKYFTKSFLAFLLDVNRYLLLRNFDTVTIPKSYISQLNIYTFNFIRPLITKFMELNSSLRWETNPRIIIESVLLEAIAD